MSMELKDRVAVITGSSGGIGSAIARRLAAKGVKIALFGGNNLDKLNAIRNELSAYADCIALPGNLTDITRFPQMLENVVEHFGGIDILVNNAGTAQSTPFEEVTPEAYDAIMNINCRVPYFLTQKALPYLRKSKAASIINIASVVAHAGYPLQSAYTASKHALLGFTKSLAAECYKDGIRVHAIAPGGVYTDMVKIARPDLTADGMIMPDDIADIVLFFVENRNNAVVDEIIVHRMNKQPFLV